MANQLLIAFLGGVGATVTPCILPLYPAFIAYLSGGGQTVTSAGPGAAALAPRRLPQVTAATLVLSGVLSGMLLIGLVVALLARPLGDFIRVVLPVADLIVIALGVLLVIGVNPFDRLPQPSLASTSRLGPALGAYAYGLLFAPIAVPCSGPVVVALFAFSLSVADFAGQLLFFLAFGVGFGLPLFMIGLLAQWRGAQVARAIVRWQRPIGIGLGLLLVAVGVWDLAVNVPNILA